MEGISRYQLVEFLFSEGRIFFVEDDNISGLPLLELFQLLIEEIARMNDNPIGLSRSSNIILLFPG